MSTAADKSERSLRDVIEKETSDLNEKIITSVKMTKELKEVEHKNHTHLVEEIRFAEKAIKALNITVE